MLAIKDLPYSKKLNPAAMPQVNGFSSKYEFSQDANLFPKPANIDVADSEHENKINLLKDRVMRMLQCRSESMEKDDVKLPDQVWSETLSFLDYVINLTPENFKKIRLHTSPITGEFVYHYCHKHPFIDAESFADELGYKGLVKDLPEIYWVGEPPIPDLALPLGINYKGMVINKNIVRYQSCISNLYHMGILDRALEKKDRKIVLEVGTGYGGLAHHLGNILSGKTTYILLDFPEMLLFSGGYLIANNPDKKIYVYDKNTFTPEFIQNEILEYDYVLIPNFVLEDLRALPDLFLMINMQSFQEMTESQISEYAAFGKEKLTGYFYSNNIDRHPLNSELGSVTVSEVLGRCFKLFPRAEEYDDPILYRNHPWYYRFYFGTPAGREESFAEDAFIKIREYVPDNAISKVGYHPIKWRKVFVRSK